MNEPGRIAVWDRPVRLLHWLLAAAVLVAWLTTLVAVGAHQPVGWVALAAVVLRLVWGATGSRYARFAQFVRAPRATFAYLRDLLRRREARYIGHNPLGGWMVLVLMLVVAGLALTGWLYTTDWLWGDELVEQLHRALAWGLLGLVALHVAGVAYTSWRHRENLVRAMLTGRKKAVAKDDVA